MIEAGALLDGIDLVVFDKDGTLIDFHAMWETWVTDLAARLGSATGRAIEGDLHRAMGTDPVSGRVLPEAPVAGSIMLRLRALAVDVARAHGATEAEAETAVGQAWLPPDPVTTARPLADLPALFNALREAGRSIGVVTADDRAPTKATLRAVGVYQLVDAIVCADDGLPPKPAPDTLLHICRELGVLPSRTAMVGDTPVDLLMGLRARAGLVIGVLSGAGDRMALAPLADVMIPNVGHLLGLPQDAGSDRLARVARG